MRMHCKDYAMLRHILVGAMLCVVMGRQPALSSHCQAGRVCRMGCILIRLHSRLRTNMVIFFMVSIAVLYFVKHNTCRSYIEIWGGLLPVQASRNASSASP